MDGKKKPSFQQVLEQYPEIRKRMNIVGFNAEALLDPEQAAQHYQKHVSEKWYDRYMERLTFTTACRTAEELGLDVDELRKGGKENAPAEFIDAFNKNAEKDYYDMVLLFLQSNFAGAIQHIVKQPKFSDLSDPLDIYENVPTANRPINIPYTAALYFFARATISGSFAISPDILKTPSVTISLPISYGSFSN